MYAGNCLSTALRLFNSESSSEKTDKHRIDLYRSIGRYKQKSEEKTAEINAAMTKLSVNNKEAESQKIEKQPKKIKKGNRMIYSKPINSIFSQSLTRDLQKTQKLPKRNQIQSNSSLLKKCPFQSQPEKKDRESLPIPARRQNQKSLKSK